MTPMIDEGIERIFLELGIMPNLKGFHYLSEAVKIGLASQTSLTELGLVSYLYPAIAANKGTTPSKVERAIRTLMDRGWNTERAERFNRVFNTRVFTITGRRPTNGEIIAFMVQQIGRKFKYIENLPKVVNEVEYEKKAEVVTHRPTVEELDLSNRLKNVLRRAGVFYIDELVQVPYNRLSRFRYMGQGCINELNQKAQEYGLPARWIDPDEENRTREIAERRALLRAKALKQLEYRNMIRKFVTNTTADERREKISRIFSKETQAHVGYPYVIDLINLALENELKIDMFHQSYAQVAKLHQENTTYFIKAFTVRFINDTWEALNLFDEKPTSKQFILACTEYLMTQM